MLLCKNTKMQEIRNCTAKCRLWRMLPVLPGDDRRTAAALPDLAPRAEEDNQMLLRAWSEVPNLHIIKVIQQQKEGWGKKSDCNAWKLSRLLLIWQDSSNRTWHRGTPHTPRGWHGKKASHTGKNRMLLGKTVAQPLYCSNLWTTTLDYKVFAQVRQPVSKQSGSDWLQALTQTGK